MVKNITEILGHATWIKSFYFFKDIIGFCEDYEDTQGAKSNIEYRKVVVRSTRSTKKDKVCKCSQLKIGITSLYERRKSTMFLANDLHRDFHTKLLVLITVRKSNAKTQFTLSWMWKWQHFLEKNTNP